MQFVQAHSALASFWAKVKSALESHLQNLGLAKKASNEFDDEATQDSLEPELPFLVVYVASKADSQAQGAWADTGMRNPVASVIGRANMLTDALQVRNLPVGIQPDVAAVMQRYEHTVKHITVLPPVAVEFISFHLPPKSCLTLCATSRHFRHILSDDRLSQTHFQQGYPVWAATDVAPRNGRTWKELVAVATKLESGVPGCTQH